MWIRWSKKNVVICFEVDIIISIITIIINIMSSADMDIANILFCCSFVNIKTWKCNHVWYQQWVVTQALHPTESLFFLISRKLPTFYFFCFYFSGFCFFFFFKLRGLSIKSSSNRKTMLFMLLNHLLFFYLLHYYNLLCLFFWHELFCIFHLSPVFNQSHHYHAR